jgi:hypothetical protein
MHHGWQVSSCHKIKSSNHRSSLPTNQLNHKKKMISSRSFSSLVLAAALVASRGASAVDIPDGTVPSSSSLSDVTTISVNLPGSIPAVDLKYYRADIVPLGNGTVSGTVYVKADPFHTGSLVYGGHLVGLQPNLAAETCNATNGCGVHIHAGYSCNSTATQLGHFFNNQTVPSDPWANQRYSSNPDGVANFASHVELGTTDVNGRAFIVHSSAGTRVACGLLQEMKVPIDDEVKPPAPTVCKDVAYSQCKDSSSGAPGVLLSKKLNRQYRRNNCKQECITASSQKDPSYLLQRGWSCGPCPK